MPRLGEIVDATLEISINNQTTVILVSLVLYKLLLIGIGFWASRRVQTADDFLLGGRNLGPWVAGLSYAASTSSAWVLLGFSGFTFAYGVSALWMLPGIWGGYVVMWLWFGPRIRGESAARQYVTPTEFISANVDGPARAKIAALAAVLITFCFIFYIAAQFDAAANAFVANFNMNSTSSLLLGAGIILLYCLLGGFWAASITDTLQGVVMMLAAIIVPVLAVVEAGGFSEIVRTVGASHPALLDRSGGHAGFAFIGFALGLSGIGLGTLGQPHLLARLMAVRGERERKQGFAIAMTWAVVVYLGMASLAMAARSLAVAPGTGEQIFYVMAEQLLPPLLAGIVIAAILSAVMSTVDSLLLAAAAAIAHDLGLTNRLRMSELTLSRIVMTSLVLAAVTLALTLPDTIFNRVLFAWNALGAAFGPVIIARILNREPVASARIWSILTGFGLTVLFYTYGTIDVADTSNVLSSWLSTLAHLPGDPFERVLPFVPPLVIVLMAAQVKPRSV
ncbi:MAG: sodium/proline symporter [Gammaproteobacteria bacterium]